MATGLAPELPLAVPEPVAIGNPSDEFPRPWSIRRGSRGRRRHDVRRSGSSGRASRRVRPGLAPRRCPNRAPCGTHSFYRGGPLHVYDHETRRRSQAYGRIDGHAVAETWEKALASSWEQPPVWVHGDMAPSNFIVRGGQLVAVIDFGCAAVGDPACDLVVAWTFFDSAERNSSGRRSHSTTHVGIAPEGGRSGKHSGCSSTRRWAKFRLPTPSIASAGGGTRRPAGGVTGAADDRTVAGLISGPARCGRALSYGVERARPAS